MPYGTILEISIMRDKYHKSKGCAWVSYSTKSQAESAIDNLHDKHCIPPQTNPLQVRLAESPPTLRGGGARSSYPPKIKPGYSLPPGLQESSLFFSSSPLQWGSPTLSGGGPFTGFAGGFHQRRSWQQYSNGQDNIPIIGADPQQQQGGETPPKRGVSRGNMFKGGRKLFVGQIPESIQKGELRQLMEAYGDVEEIVMLKDHAAFVIFKDKEMALRALDALRTNATFHVRPANGEGEEDECKLFVGMIPYETTEEALTELFATYGELSEVVILRQDGRSRGAAFVRYQNKEAAAIAVLELNNRHIMLGSSHPMVVQIASAGRKGTQKSSEPHLQFLQGYSSLRMTGMGGGRGRGGGGFHGTTHPQGSQAPSTGAPPIPRPQCGPRGANLFVRNLSTSVTNQDLERVFSLYGELVSATVFRDRVTGNSRGFGFVSYATVEEAAHAIAGLNGTHLQGQPLQVDVKNGERE